MFNDIYQKTMFNEIEKQKILMKLKKQIFDEIAQKSFNEIKIIIFL